MKREGKQAAVATEPAERLGRLIADRTALVGIIGMGYVGLPLGIAVAQAGFRVQGFDIDPDKVKSLNAGRSYIGTIAGELLAKFVKDGRFSASADFAELARCAVVIICVPTPLTKYREPDLYYVEETT